MMIRARTSEQALDLGPDDAARLRNDIGASLAAYGAEVVRVVVTHVRPPEDFAQSREAARLATVQRAEEHEVHALEMLKLADRDEQERERIRLRRAAIELEADNEAARLERLESRIHEFPSAMHWDVDGRRLDVAEALATNTRAMVQVGPGVDVAASLLMPSGSDATVGDPGWLPLQNRFGIEPPGSSEDVTPREGLESMPRTDAQGGEGGARERAPTGVKRPGRAS